MVTHYIIQLSHGGDYTAILMLSYTYEYMDTFPYTDPPPIPEICKNTRVATYSYTHVHVTVQQV